MDIPVLLYALASVLFLPASMYLIWILRARKEDPKTGILVSNIPTQWQLLKCSMFWAIVAALFSIAGATN